jgi:hypothetical protein
MATLEDKKVVYKEVVLFLEERLPSLSSKLKALLFGLPLLLWLLSYLDLSLLVGLGVGF